MLKCKTQKHNIPVKCLRKKLREKNVRWTIPIYFTTITQYIKDFL